TRIGLEGQVVFLEAPSAAVGEGHVVHPSAVSDGRHLLLRRQVLEIRDRAILSRSRKDGQQRGGHNTRQPLHGFTPTRSSLIPAIGTKRGWPYLSTPYVSMTFWVAGATMKSANALPPALFTRGPLAGFTSITE